MASKGCFVDAIVRRRTSLRSVHEFPFHFSHRRRGGSACGPYHRGYLLAAASSIRATCHSTGSHAVACTCAAACAYPPKDEWEAHAPYPDHVRAVSSLAAPPYHRTPDSRHPDDNHFRHYDGFEFDDVEPIESHDAPPPRQAGLTTARDVEFSMFHPSSAIVPSSPAANVSTRCPRCNSAHVDTLNVARIAGSTIGSVAGATGGFAMAISGAEAGAAVGAIGGPLGALFGGLTGAVLAGLPGSAAGNAAGSAVGAAIDENMLDNYRCLSCGHTFGAQHA
jgi:DNA-directed RNA polymerase subunit RPC12/RpoP